MKKLSILVTMFAMAVMFMANDANAANLPVAGSDNSEEATINESDYDVTMESTLTLEVNETFTLEPLVSPSTAQTSFTWYTMDDVVAKVSQSGAVTGMTVGTTVIVATAANGKKAKCTVTVTSAAPNPIGDMWKGSYQVTSDVTREYVSNYNYPSEFNVTIKEVDGAYYITELIGMDLTQSIYEGLRINVIDEHRAEIDLTFTNDMGNFTMTGGFLSCMYLISSQSDYELGVIKDGKIGLTRRLDGTLIFDDFYVFAFGLVSNFELAVDAVYQSIECKSTDFASRPSSVPAVAVDNDESDQLKIYNLTGTMIYSGCEDDKPQLAPGVYVFYHGGNAQKVLVP